MNNSGNNTENCYKNLGQRLYERAKELIPGGTQLLSKRPEMFLPGQWPSYFKRAQGIEIWDMDDKHYFDMSIMGIGTCSLGYANPEVNKAVINAVNNGTMSSLNCYEEVQLAEKLIELHPYCEMVRFSRTGGEACAVAARIGRAVSGKSKIAVCGYHGWHDWYLAANIINPNNLDGLLLSGLEAAGVAKELSQTTLTFHYGNIEELEAIVAGHGSELGVIFIEIQRGRKPDLVFLNNVRQIANNLNAVLVFDEVSSGFRLSIGGVYKLYDLEPDIVVLGKTLGNGYAISAVIGKREVMEAAQKSFISSSYWTERIGFVAALETIKQFEQKNVIDYLKHIGQYIGKGLKDIFNEMKLNIEIDGMPTVPILIIKEENPLVIKTLFTQEMLKKGFLASNIIYLSFVHDRKVIDQYLSASFEVFRAIRSGINKGDIKNYLEGPICHSGFQRLT